MKDALPRFYSRRSFRSRRRGREVPPSLGLSVLETGSLVLLWSPIERAISLKSFHNGEKW